MGQWGDSSLQGPLVSLPGSQEEGPPCALKSATGRLLLLVTPLSRAAWSHLSRETPPESLGKEYKRHSGSGRKQRVQHCPLSVGVKVGDESCFRLPHNSLTATARAIVGNWAGEGGAVGVDRIQNVLSGTVSTSS